MMTVLYSFCNDILYDQKERTNNVHLTVYVLLDNVLSIVCSECIANSEMLDGYVMFWYIIMKIIIRRTWEKLYQKICVQRI